MIILEDILSQEIVQRLGWTLLHFIWQAAVVALLLAILLRLLRKSTANLRYIFACLALGLIVLLPVITIKLVPVSQPFTAANLEPAPEPTVMPAVEMPAPDTIVIAKSSWPDNADVVPSIPFKQRVVDTLEPALPYIVSGWLIGVFGLSIWNLGGWTQLQRLKRRMVKQVDSILLDRLKLLTQKLKVKQTVRLMESAIVQIPTVVGWLRPVILLPASALSGLNTEQLEAIIAHELAHIKRFDYLINILQTVVETLGFYHPAVWWISYKIRAERENCCDDMAVSISGDRVSYAGALASMEEIRAAQAKLAVAATGGNLFRRICRLLGKDSAENTGLSWVPAATAILLIIALAIPTTLALTDKPDSMLTETKTDALNEDINSEETVSPQLSFGQAVEGVQCRLRGDKTIWKAGELVKLKIDLLSDKEREFPHYGPPLDVFEVMINGRWYQRTSNFFAGLRSIAPSQAKHRDGLYFGFRPQDWRQKSDGQLMKLIPGKHVLRVAFPFASKEGKKAQQHRAISNPVEIEILPVEKTNIQVENDINATSQNEESPADKNPPAIVLAKSIVPLDEDKACIQIDCFVVELSPDTKIDPETLTEARKILGSNISYSNSKIDVIMNASVEAMNAFKDKSIENKHLTKDRYKAFIDMLTSKGYIKILMNPRIETPNGKTATIISSQKVPLQQAINTTPVGGKIIRTLNENEYVKVVDLIEITPHVSADGNIMLEVKADFGSQDISVSEKSAPLPSRQFATRMLAHPGEILIMGGLIENHPAPGNTVNNAVKQAKELLLILIPTIKTPPANLKEITDKQIEGFKRELSTQNLKKLGLAVAMYADDHDDNLPQSIQELKPYIRDRQDFDWLRDNVEYFDKGKTAQRNAHFIPIAYDKTLFEKADGTNVLFLDFSVRFVDIKEFEKLDLKRAEFIIDAKFLSVSKDFLKSIKLDIDSTGKDQSNLTLTPETLKSLNFSKTQSLILNDLDVNLLLNAARVNKDSKVLANPQVLTPEGTTAEIAVMNKDYYYITGYTEPNRPSEKPQPKLEKVEEGINISLSPKLTPKKYIDMQFELEIINVSGFEEKMYKGKYPYKLPSRQSIDQATRYIAKNGQTLLFGPHKIVDRQDGQTEQKDLLVLITAHTIGFSEQDKPAQAKRPALLEPPSTTTKVITPPAIAKSRAERQKENEQKPLQVQAKEDFELPEITKRMESAKKLSSLGKALLIYAKDHDDRYPDSLRQLSDYFKKVEDFHWVLENVMYLASGKMLADRPDAAIAYDKKLLIKEKGTNVLFNDCHVGFEKAEDLKKLGINIIRNEFLIEARFLAVNKDFIENINNNADSPDEAQELLKLKSELFAAVDGPNKLSFIPPDRNVSLLLKAVRAHKDSKVIATQDVICREDTTAEIAVMTKEYYYIKGYTEPNKPSKKLQQKPDRVEEGISLSLRPKMAPNNNIKIDFEIETSQFLDFEERDLKGKPPKVQRHAQSLTYRVQNGQTFLMGGHTIADRQDGRTEEKDLLVLITAHTIGFSEQDKPAKAERLIVTEPPRITSKVITPPAIAKSSTERPKDDEKEKTKPPTVLTRPDESIEPNDPMVTVNFNKVEMKTIIEKLAEWTGKIIIPTADSMSQKITTYGPEKVQRSKAVEMIYSALRLIGYTIEQTDDTIFLKPIAKVKTGEVLEISEDYPLSMVENKDRVVQKFFKLKHYSPSRMAQIILPLVGEYGYVSADEGTGNLLVIDTAKNLMRIEKIIEQYDVSKADETVTEIFEIRNGDPVEIVELLKKLINGRPEAGAIIEQGIEPIVLIPEPRRKWIIAKASTENIKQIGEWIQKLDTDKTTMGLDPIDKAVHQQLEMIIDLSHLRPEMSFSEVIENIKVSVDPPLQIQPIWKDLLENAEVEQTTPAGMDPLTGVKLRKALEILLTSVSSTGLPKLTYRVDKGVILVGTAEMLPPKMVHRFYDISDPLESAADSVLSTRKELEKTTPAIKPQEMQILRQQYINNDLKVKSLSEKVTKVENELNTARQQFTQSHPQVQQKSRTLRALKNALQERKKEVGKSFDDIMTKEIHQTNQEQIATLLDELRKTQEHQQPLQQAQEKIAKLLDESEELMTPLQQIQKQLDELIKQQQEALKVTEPNLPPTPKVPLIDESEKPKTPLEQIQKQLDELLKQQQKALKITEPNLPPAQKVKFINNTFIDCPLIDALQYIAAAGNVTIIPDENVKGLVSCTLKDVTVETALDIVLGGTPYVWKKTPYYYLVASKAESFEFTARMESANKLSNLGKALLIYANDHNDKYPNSLFTFSEYMKWQDFSWIRQNVEYLASGKTPADRPDTVIAYDKKLLEKGKGTNVLYNDCHVNFVKAKELKKLGISESEIMIETQFWSVTEDFLKDVGLDANFENFSNDWRGHLAATYPAGPNGKPYGLMIDDLHLTFLLRAIQSNDDSKAIVAPRILTREGTTAEMRFLTEEYHYVTGYNEPNSPSEKPEPKRDKVEIGTRLWVTPKLTDNNRNINMDLKLEITQLEGIIEGKYKEKYPIYKPIVDVISAKLPCTIPDGNAMLIGGLKINEHITKKPGAPGLGDLPLIGAVFGSKDKTKDQKMLLILIKPITNPQQKATKILPGQEDSEEHIRRLAEQLDKKFKLPTN